MRTLLRIIDDFLLVVPSDQAALCIGAESLDHIQDKILAYLYERQLTEPVVLGKWIGGQIGRLHVIQILERLKLSFDKNSSLDDLVGLWFAHREHELLKPRVRPVGMARSIAELANQIKGTPRLFDASTLLTPFLWHLMRCIGHYYTSDLQKHHLPPPAGAPEPSLDPISFDFPELCSLLATDQRIKLQPYNAGCDIHVRLSNEEIKGVLRRLADLTGAASAEDKEAINHAFSDAVLQLLDFWQVAQDHTIIPKGLVVAESQSSPFSSQLTCHDEFNNVVSVMGQMDRISIGDDLLLAQLDQKRVFVSGLKPLPRGAYDEPARSSARPHQAPTARSPLGYGSAGPAGGAQPKPDGQPQERPSPVTAQHEPVVLTLRFAPTRTGAGIYWESTQGETLSQFRLPYDSQQLPTVIKALDAAQYPGHPITGPQFTDEEQARLERLGLWKDGQVPANAHRTVGRKLYKALTADEKGKLALRKVREYARSQGWPVSYVLRFPVGAVELASLPWEALWDERQAVLLSRGARELDSCQRHLSIDEAPSPQLPINRKLYILALVPEVGVAPEVRRAERAARRESWDRLKADGLLDYDELEYVTIADLDSRMRQGPQPDIIHFYGHGTFSKGEGCLLFDNPELPRRREWVGAQRLSVQLGGVRLVVLHACQSAMFADDEYRGGLLTGIAPALSAVSEAVVAMQLTIRASAATQFSRVFYGEIARGRSLQAAVAEGRRSLFSIEGDGASWYVPTLYIRTREPRPVYLVQPA